MNDALTLFVGTWKSYVLFAVCVGVYRQWLLGKLNVLNKVAFGPVLIYGFIGDWLFNYTILSLIWGWPPTGAHTISSRFKIYHFGDAPTPFAKTVATFTCEKLLNTIDPTGAHC